MWKVLFLLLPRLLPRPRPLKPPPAWVREAPFLHTPLCLASPTTRLEGKGGWSSSPGTATPRRRRSFWKGFSRSPGLS